MSLTETGSSLRCMGCGKTGALLAVLTRTFSIGSGDFIWHAVQGISNSTVMLLHCDLRRDLAFLPSALVPSFSHSTALLI